MLIVAFASQGSNSCAPLPRWPGRVPNPAGGGSAIYAVTAHAIFTRSKCENSHFGPLLTTLSDDDDDDNDDDDDGWLVDVDIIHSDQPVPAIPAAATRGLPTPPTVSSSNSEDVGVKLTVDDGPITAAAEGIVRLHSKPKVSQLRCGLVFLLWLFSVFGGRMGQNWREIYVRATKSVSRLFFLSL